MKITKIEIFRTQVPFLKTYVMADGRRTESSNQLYIKMHTDEGIVGLGEASGYAPYGTTIDLVEYTIEKILAPAVIGQDPTNLRKINDIMNKTLYRNLEPKAAIDIACHDILGKKLGVPVYTLLGGAARDEVLTCWPVGAEEPDELYQTAKWVVDELKCGSIYCKIGDPWNVQNDVDRLSKVREAVGPNVSIFVDVNGRWTYEQALEFGKKAEFLRLDGLEQPVDERLVDDWVRLRQRIDIPLSLDEGVNEPEILRAHLEAKSVDVISIKPCKEGGISATWRDLKLAESYGVPTYANTMHEQGVMQAASFHIAMASTNFYGHHPKLGKDLFGHLYVSPMRLKEDVTDYYLQFKEGKIVPNGKPGLGVEFRQEILEKYLIGKTIVID